MSEKQKTHIDINTVNGDPDLSSVEATDYVSFKPEGARGILLPAGQVLTSDRTPISEAPDGSIPRLDGAHVIKLGGEVIAVAESQAK